MDKAFFSIITPTHNRLETGFLRKAIQSVINQVGDNFKYEHIIINDASDDNTSVFLERMAKKYPHLKIVNNETNLGTAKCYKIGIDQADGDYVTFLDDDDKLPKYSLKRRAKYIFENPEVDWFIARARWIDVKGKLIKTLKSGKPPENHQYEVLLYQNYVHGGTPVIKRSCFEKIIWPVWLNRSQDYFMWLELSRPQNGFTLGFLDDFVYSYRRHGKQFTERFIKDKKVWEQKWLLNERIKRDFHPNDLAYLAILTRKLDYKNKILERQNKEYKRVLKEHGLEKELKFKSIPKLLKTSSIRSASDYSSK